MDMDYTQMRTWAEISLKNIEHNYKAMRARLKEGTRFLGVVKADAYGHGAVRVAERLQELQCDYLGVACIDEALSLRENGITLPILIMGYTPPQLVSRLLEYGLTQTVYSLPMAEEFSQEALRLGKKLKVHLKADSGMGRLGFICHGGRDPGQEMVLALKLPGLYPEGIFTHFAISDVCGDDFTEKQYGDFKALVERLEHKAGIKFAIKHCANSGAMINYDWSYGDMVRPGIMLYGLYPDKETGGIELRPVMELKARIAQIKELEAGDTVSYGRIYTAPGRRKIAVVTIGYADGLHRVLSGKMDVLIRGRRARQVGRICMDMCMVDVTEIPDAAVGDAVTIFGRDGSAYISLEEQAALAGTISWELLCAVSPRVPRVYLTD
ncbi:alanine racemase [Sporobacter termitidis DSM 10068]|uniref:Alanine racemase n=1 Tax=Sporobacter termitidis DSM 10068 TaxID=1123282 RepID=A0A1M5WE94_9FIRM|nr:alanine racemase [Sporobacter termitidis]SHH85826.1 alanine racemase [Sporobacter termitidis DSM 10068]